jgi:hypothetical protein
MISYSENESLERIYKVLIGTNPDDRNGFLGQTARNESLAKIAQLMEGDSSDSFAPLTFLDDQFGGIYTWTGTASITGLANAWTKLTGTFQNSMVQSAKVTGQPSSDRIYVQKYGTYFVSWQMSFEGSPDINYKIEPFTSSVGVPQAAAIVRPTASGSVTSFGGCGYLHTSGTSTYVSLYVLAGTAGAWFKPITTQLCVRQVSNT